MSRGVYRGVHSSLFDDPDYQKLSARARHVLLTVRLCREAGPAVIFRYYPSTLALQTGLSRHYLEAALTELATAEWIVCDGVVLWVRNGLRYDPQVRLSSAKHREAVIRQLEGLPKSPIIATFCQYYGIGKATERLSVAHRQAIPSDTESDTDTEKEKDTESESEAERIGAHAPGVERAPAPPPPPQRSREEMIAALASSNGITPEQLREQAHALARTTAASMKPARRR